MNVYVSRTDGVGCSALLKDMLLRGVCVVVYSIPLVCKVSLLSASLYVPTLGTDINALKHGLCCYGLAWLLSRVRWLDS